MGITMRPECDIEDCDKPVHGRGLCSKHYLRLRRTGTTDLTVRVWMNEGECNVEGCDRPARTRDMCAKHYNRWWTYGDPLYVSPRKERTPIGTKYTTPGGYILVRVGPDHMCAGPHGRSGRLWPMEHHVVMSEHLGRAVDTAAGEQVHHINGQRDDNRIENLELWSTSQPSGQRVEDKLAWAVEIIERYGPEFTGTLA